MVPTTFLHGVCWTADLALVQMSSQQIIVLVTPLVTNITNSSLKTEQETATRMVVLGEIQEFQTYNSRAT